MSNSKQYGLTFNGHHTSEFDAYVVEDTVSEGFPAKTKTLVDLPGSSKPLDLSNIYGPVYGERVLSFTFLLMGNAARSREGMYRAWTRILNWLMKPTGKTVLQDDLMSDWHYLAEVQDAASLAEAMQLGQLTVSFQCYPFRIRNKAEFDDIWDTFDFDMDVAQNTHFVVGSRANGVLINTGVADVAITATASEALTVTIGSQSYPLDAGANSSTELALPAGESSISVSGSDKATVDFSWHQEAI